MVTRAANCFWDFLRKNIFLTSLSKTLVVLEIYSTITNKSAQKIVRYVLFTIHCLIQIKT